MVNKYLPSSQTITTIYIILMGIVLGASLYAGAIVAPVIFHSEDFLGEILSQYQEGILMTQNFIRLGFLVNILVLMVVFYEFFQWKTFKSDKLTLIASFLVVASGLLFTSYYLPDIIAMQEVGEAMTKSSAFVATHKGSEINFKIFAFALIILMLKNIKKVNA